MTLNLDLAPQLEAQINAEAQKYGLQPLDLLRRVIEERFGIAPNQIKSQTAQERIDAMDALAEQNAGLPILTDSAFDREPIYGDHL